MARTGAYFWNYNRLNVWFGLGSLILFLCIVAMVVDDYVREWKGYQRRFNRLEVQKTREKIKEEEQKIDKAKLEELKKAITEAEKEIRANKKKFQDPAQKIKTLDAALYKYQQEYQFAKSRFDAVKYRYEVAQHEGKIADAEEIKKQLDREERLMGKWKDKMGPLEIEKKQLEAEYQIFLKKKEELQRNLDQLLAQKNRLEKKLEAIRHGVRSWILNLPILDFIAPTLKIQQVVLDDIKEEYHFTKVPKVDRCMTCHLAVDKEGWEKETPPFRSHPRLDLFVSPNSPHPVEKFGCTVCHQGMGQATTFFRTAHTPRDEAQKKEWEKKYGWKPMKYVEEKMVPMPLIESSCYQCHNQGVVDVKEAPKLSAGKELFKDLDCYGCHAVKGFQDFRKTGPDLNIFASKTGPDWAFKWLKDPRGFRPTTKMPKVFDLSNTQTPADIEVNNVEIDAIVQYLFKNAKELELAKMPERGDAQKGKELVKSVGCTGCHAIGEWKKPQHGPDLNGVGSKLNSDWLYNWIKDPKRIWSDTRMPNLRLTDEETRDITAYLMTLKNEKFDATSLPTLSDSVLDEVTLEYLTEQYGAVIGKAKLGTMSKEEKKIFVGKWAIDRQGCFGCHNTPGFEKTTKIGTDLTEEGSKDVHSFDFGFLPIEETRQAWFFQKMKDPRSFDQGRVKKRDEKFRMPDFQLTDEETQALTIFLMSLKKSEIPPHLTQQLSEKEQAVEAGRRMAREWNCQGCHLLEGKGGAIAETLEPGLAPPPLEGEGEKVWGDWLHRFLREPSTIRPWLQVRMPTFWFSDDDATAFVRYFEELSNQKFSYKGKEIPHPTPEQWQTGKQIFDKLQCIKCHRAEPAPGQSFADLAPDLALARERLKPRWIIKWMVDPNQLYPGTKMPGFFPDLQSPLPDILGGDAKEQIKALRDYVVNFAVEP